MTTVRFQTAPFGTSFSDKQLLVELRRASAMALRAASSLVMPRPGQKASDEPSEVTSHGLCSAVTVAACSWPRSPKALTETRN